MQNKYRYYLTLVFILACLYTLLRAASGFPFSIEGFISTFIAILIPVAILAFIQGLFGEKQKTVTIVKRKD